MEISSSLARRISLNAQLLDGSPPLPGGKDGVFRTIQRLGYIQIDTISVIKRSHHHTLWSRHPDYSEEMLHELQAADRRIFEYWGHAMSYLPLFDYRFYLPKMQNFRNPANSWIKQQLNKCGNLLEPVLERVRKEGARSSQDFEPPPGRRGGTWWDWKPAKMALELLFWRGELMISRRENFQKIYDLTERVLPPGVDTTQPGQEELGRFLVRRALQALGIAGHKTILKFLQPESSRDSDLQMVKREMLAQTVQNLTEEGEVMEVQVEGNKNMPHYTLPGILNSTEKFRDQPAQLFLLSPFDNLIIQRDRIKRLFGFDYALECYLPVSKRRYGYFNLPILWGENFIGRLDPKADRINRTLLIQNMVFQEPLTAGWDFLPDLAQKVGALARFNECEKITVNSAVPSRIRYKLNPLLKKALKN